MREVTSITLPLLPLQHTETVKPVVTNPLRVAEPLDPAYLLLPARSPLVDEKFWRCCDVSVFGVAPAAQSRQWSLLNDIWEALSAGSFEPRSLIANVSSSAPPAIGRALARSIACGASGAGVERVITREVGGERAGLRALARHGSRGPRV